MCGTFHDQRDKKEKAVNIWLEASAQWIDVSQRTLHMQSNITNKCAIKTHLDERRCKVKKLSTCNLLGDDREYISTSMGWL